MSDDFMDDWSVELRERYQRVRHLGHGAFGEVTLALDRSSGLHVALKHVFLRAGPDGAAALREARALQAIAHPNVVALVDVHAEANCIHLVQELCSSDLSHLLAACYSPLPPAIAKGLVQQLLTALEACHAAGVTHRDVKPSNVLLSFDGMLKLGDFGLAKGGAEGQNSGGSCAPIGDQDGGSGGGGIGSIGGDCVCLEGDSRSNSHSRSPSPSPSSSQRGDSGWAGSGEGRSPIKGSGGKDGAWSSPLGTPRSAKAVGAVDPSGILGLGDSSPCAGGAAAASGMALTCHSPAVATRWYRPPELLYGSREYDGAAVDVWGAGMVFAEMLGLGPLIPGNSDIGQLALMQQLLGSISPSEWPEVQHLPDWGKVVFDCCSGSGGLAMLLPDAPDDALDLLGAMIRYPPYSRLTASLALRHPYFSNSPLPAGPADVAAFAKQQLALRERVTSQLAALQPGRGGHRHMGSGS